MKSITRCLIAYLLVQVAFTESALAARYDYTYVSSGDLNMFAFDRQGTYSISGTLSFTAESNANLSFTFDNLGQIIDSSIPVSDVHIRFNDGISYRRQGQFPVSRNTNYGLTNGASSMRFATDLSGAPNDWSLRFSATTDGRPNSSLGTWTDHALDGQGFVRESVVSNVGTANPVRSSPPFNPWQWNSVTPPPEHIIVLTHGWSKPEALGTNYLSESLRPAIEAQLASRGVNLDSVEFISEPWDEAFTYPNYLVALGGTSEAGTLLANRIHQKVDSRGDGEPKPTLHMIGHSLGTVTNAWAISGLTASDFSAIQVTILDSPRGVGSLANSVINSGLTGIKQQALQSIAAPFFWDTIPESTDATPVYVENFYGTEASFSDLEGIWDTLRPPTFGQPIAGTNPVVGDGNTAHAIGYQIPRANHETVYNEYYQAIIAGEQHENSVPFAWRTPALYDIDSAVPALEWKPNRSRLTESLISEIEAADDRISLRVREDLYPIYERGEFFRQTFDPESPLFVNSPNSISHGIILLMADRLTETLIATIGGGSLSDVCDGDGTCPFPLLNQSEIVEAWMLEAGEVEFRENAFSLLPQSPASVAALINTDDVLSLKFTYALVGSATDTFAVLVDGEVAYRSSVGMGAGEVFIDLLPYEGIRRISWLYDSEVAEARLTVLDLQVLQVVQVPEPSAFMYFLLALVSLTLLCRQTYVVK